MPVTPGGSSEAADSLPSRLVTKACLSVTPAPRAANWGVTVHFTQQPIREQPLSSQPRQKKLFKTYYPDKAQKPRLPDPIIQPIAVMPPSRTPTPDTKLALEAELKTLEAKIKFMEGKMTEFLPRPIALSPQNSKPKAVKRPAAPVTKPAKSNKSKNSTDSDFVFPKKTVKNTPLEEKKEIKINNTFEALTSDKTDVEDVTPAYKIKPIFMRIIDSYNLVLQDLHRKYIPQLPTPIPKDI
ncbi:hypothetical protein TNCV_4748621 [Trichonephila clavipes]|nr:hypothetical protein TNCV_4748621 [Trichonephila clavipes]